METIIHSCKWTNLWEYNNLGAIVRSDSQLANSRLSCVNKVSIGHWNDRPLKPDKTMERESINVRGTHLLSHFQQPMNWSCNRMRTVRSRKWRLWVWMRWGQDRVDWALASCFQIWMRSRHTAQASKQTRESQDLGKNSMTNQSALRIEQTKRERCYWIRIYFRVCWDPIWFRYDGTGQRMNIDWIWTDFLNGSDRA